MAKKSPANPGIEDLVARALAEQDRHLASKDEGDEEDVAAADAR